MTAVWLLIVLGALLLGIGVGAWLRDWIEERIDQVDETGKWDRFQDVFSDD